MTTLPKISKFVQKKNLACREYPFIITPNPGESTYGSSTDILFRISAGDDKSRLRCIYGPATYGSYEIVLYNDHAADDGITYLDGNSNCVFSRITTNGPGGILEEFNKPNVYLPCHFDMCVSRDERIGIWTAFGNYDLCQNDYVGAATGGNTEALINAAINTAAVMLRYNDDQIRRGYKFGTVTHGTTAATSTVKQAFAFILPSILGAFSKKLFPISELSQSSLDITLQTESDQNALIYSAGSVKYQLSKLRLNLSIVEYNSVISDVIKKTYNQNYVIPCNSIQHFSQNITTSATGSFTLSFNATLQNAKGILFAFIDADNQTGARRSLTGRTSLGITQAQLTIGPYSFPSNKFLTYDGTTAMASKIIHPNYFLSAMKYFGNHIDTGISCSTNIKDFNTCGATANGTFVLAFSLEGIHEQDDEFRSTIPLDGYTTFLNFTTGVTSAGNTTVNCFILYEFDVVIQAGTAMVQNKLTSMNGGMYM